MKKQLILVTKPNCLPCQSWKNYFKKNNIPFIEVNCKTSEGMDKLEPKMMRFIASKYKNSVPIIFYGFKQVNCEVNDKIRYQDRVKEWGL